MDLDLLKAVLSIAVVDLVLSGDNAVVIALAARSLQLPVEDVERVEIGATVAQRRAA